jgi:DnaJ-class molecular chaperone
LSTTTSGSSTNYYKVLGVRYGATSREITRAYREAMKRHHPDAVAPSQRELAEEHAKLLNLAMRTLTKPDERLKYDQSIRAELVQEGIMSHYFGGMGIPGDRSDRFGEGLRREQTAFEKREKRQSDRGATLTVLLYFAAITALVVCSLVVWAVASALGRELLERFP